MTDFEKLRKLTGEVADLAAAFAVLEWDQQVYMPPGAAADRACQMETLAGELHRRIIAPPRPAGGIFCCPAVFRLRAPGFFCFFC